MRRSLLALAALSIAAGCSTEHVTKTIVVEGTAVDHGKALFSDHAASPSTLNSFSCETCHFAEAGDGDRIVPGAPLAGAAFRPTFWGGQENDLLRSINDCRYQFMGAQQPWTADDEDAKAMYAYLSSLPKQEVKAVPFAVLASVADLDPGDPKVGADAFTHACQACHGAVHTGEGRLTERASRLPDDTLKEHAEFSVKDQRVIFIEKMRHGGFHGYGGAMPPFAEDVLTDDQVAGLLSYFDLYKK